jgi:hypothetical protein
MRKQLKQSLFALTIFLSTFTLAEIVAQIKAKAMPIETATSPIFQKNYTATGGLDYGFNQPNFDSRSFNNATDNLFQDGDRVRVGSDNVLFFSELSSRRLSSYIRDGQRIYQQVNSSGQIVDIVVPESAVVRDDAGRPIQIDPAQATVIGNNTTVIRRCSNGELSGNSCRTPNRAGNSLTGYVQGAIRTGGNTSVLGGYDSNGNTAYVAGAVKWSDLAMTLGYDNKGLTYSAAYSIGAVSPFYAKQRGLNHYGMDLRFSSDLSVNAAYRSDNSYLAGLRVDVSGK